jgi:EmrB/QacA subfamily drug resistance transporter
MHRPLARPLAHEAPALDRSPWSLLVLLCLGQFMVVIDMTVVNVALPSIGRSLGFGSLADLQWVVTAYVLLSGGLVLLGGRAADLLGRRRMLLSGLLLFTAASLASGLAPSPAALVASRAAQGVGAALLTPAALAIITTAYTGAQRTTGLAVWGAIGAAGAAAGLLLGGALTTWLGWRSIFFVNVPVGLVVVLLGARLVPGDEAGVGRPGRLDLGGTALLVGGLVSLVYAVEGAATSGWGSSRTLAALVFAAALLAGFVMLERVVAHPLVPPSVWRVRSLVSGVVAMLGATGAMGGIFFLTTLELQRVLGASPLQAGLAFLPLILAVAAASQLGSRLLPHLGTRWVLVAGMAVAAGGALLLARAPLPPAYVADLLPGFLLLGVGLGLAFVAISVTTMADVEGDRAGLASGLMMTGHEVGGALGVAVLSAVATAVAASSGFAAGYRAGLLAAGLLGGAVALLALVTVPSVRPRGAPHARLHGG